jgi:hypothetical protein
VMSDALFATSAGMSSRSVAERPFSYRSDTTGIGWPSDTRLPTSELVDRVNE